MLRCICKFVASGFGSDQASAVMRSSKQPGETMMTLDDTIKLYAAAADDDHNFGDDDHDDLSHDFEDDD